MFESVFRSDYGKFIYFVLRINNYCNLNCEYCLTGSNRPIDKNGIYEYRRKAYTLTPKEVQLFCERFKGIGEGQTHQISGGEPTMTPPKTFAEIVDILYFHKRPTCMMTNGFALLDIPPTTLNKLSCIDLDNHGINNEHIRECKQYLKKVYTGKVRELKIMHHFDFSAFKGCAETRGKKCPTWLRAPAMEDRVIYPCCTVSCTALLDNDIQIKNSLIAAGWTLDNKDVLNTIRNHKDTLPACVIDRCENKCYNPISVWPVRYKVPITLKSNDIIKKHKKRDKYISIFKIKQLFGKQL